MIGKNDNGIAFPGSIDFEMFNRVIKRIPDRGEWSKIRRVILDWFKLDTNANPRRYVILPKAQKIPAIKSNDKKKKEAAWQDWLKAFRMIQKGFYDACVRDMLEKKKHALRMGIYGKLGDLDSYQMKERVKALFDEIDTDGSGEVDMEELRVAFEALDCNFEDDELRDFVAEFDDDGSGLIEFEEFLLLVEKLLMDARHHLNAKEKPDFETGHVKYFMQSLLYQEIRDGMLERPVEEAHQRTIAVMWGFDPALMGREFSEPGEEIFVDAMDALRKSHLESRGKQMRSEDMHELERPDWFKFTPAWKLKEEIYRFMSHVDVDEFGDGNDVEDEEEDEWDNPEDKPEVATTLQGVRTESLVIDEGDEGDDSFERCMITSKLTCGYAAGHDHINEYQDGPPTEPVGLGLGFEGGGSRPVTSGGSRPVTSGGSRPVTSGGSRPMTALGISNLKKLSSAFSGSDSVSLRR